MVNEFKRIILLDGLQHISDYYFRVVKSLLASELKLTEKMQEEYDRIKIANLLETRFQGVACVDKLIESIKNIPELEETVRRIKRKKLKAVSRIRAQSKTPVKKKNSEGASSSTSEPPANDSLTSGEAERTLVDQKKKKTTKEHSGTQRNKAPQTQTHCTEPGEPSTSTAMGHRLPAQTSSSTPSSTSSNKDTFNEHITQRRLENYVLRCESVQLLKDKKGSSISLNENLRPETQPKDASRSVLQKSPILAMVLKSTKLFKYMTLENRESTMFHATVATKTEFFHVKVFNSHLKNKFTRNKIIIISDHFEHRGFLEVKENSSVIEVYPDKTFDVPKEVINAASNIPTISTICKKASGTIVSGLFTLKKKTVNTESTIYEIQDNTGKIEVIGKRECHSIICKEGDKIELICFRLQTKDGRPKLVSEMHSFIQVKTETEQKIPESKTLLQKPSQLPAASTSSSKLMQPYTSNLQWPQPCPSSSTLIMSRDNGPMRILLCQGQSGLPAAAGTRAPPTPTPPPPPPLRLPVSHMSTITNNHNFVARCHQGLQHQHFPSQEDHGKNH